MSSDDTEDMFLDVDDGVLNEHDYWKDVCTAVSSVSPTSRELAKNLGLKPEDIASIFANFQLSDKDRLSEVIKYWLQWNFNYQKEGKPSWKTLAKAVHPLNPSLAESIAQKHKAIGGKQSGSIDKSRKRSRPVRSQEAPKLNNLLPALADLPADKIPQFAIALGVPEPTAKTAESNHPKDADRVKMECLKWWMNNSDDISWEAIARALMTKGVDQKNLARKILSEKCGQSFSTTEEDEVDAEPKKYQRFSREGVNESDTIQQEFVSGDTNTDSKARTADNTSAEEDIQSWSVGRVVKYFESTSNCKPFAKFCQDQEIDGNSLLGLSEDFLKKYEVKAGLAVKVMRHVENLKSKMTSE